MRFNIGNQIYMNVLFRCYNCGEFANHIAAKCALGPQPKRCHNCKSEDHLIADCPQRPETSSSGDAAMMPPLPTSHNGNGSTNVEGMAQLHISE